MYDARNDEATEAVVPPRTYVQVFVALLALTAATVWLSFADLGEWHAAVGLAIAAAKAVLIGIFFMHVLRGSRLLCVIAVAALFWLGILMTLTMTDYLTRSWHT